jgi:hypothetical protein
MNGNVTNRSTYGWNYSVEINAEREAKLVFSA